MGLEQRSGGAAAGAGAVALGLMGAFRCARSCDDVARIAAHGDDIASAVAHSGDVFQSAGRAFSRGERAAAGAAHDLGSVDDFARNVGRTGETAGAEGGESRRFRNRLDESELRTNSRFHVNPNGALASEDDVAIIREIQSANTTQSVSLWTEIDNASELSAERVDDYRNGIWSPKTPSEERALLRTYLSGQIDQIGTPAWLRRMPANIASIYRAEPPPAPSWSDPAKVKWTMLGQRADFPSTVKKERVRVVSLLNPDMESLKRVFEKQLVEHQVEGLRKALEAVQLEAHLEVSTSRGTSLGLSSGGGDADVVIVLGHSEDTAGEAIRLSDGTSIRTTELHRACALVNRRCIVICCHSQDLDIGFTIGVDEAANSLIETLRATSTSELTVDDFVARIRTDLVTNRRLRIGLSVSIAAVGSGGIAWVATDSDEPR